MVDKYFDGELPYPDVAIEEDEELRQRALQLIDTYEELMGGLGFHKALMAVWDVVNLVNKYIDTMAPWVLAKSDRKRLATVMVYILETVKIVSVLVWPVMPASAERIQEQLGLSRKGEEFTLGHIRNWGEDRPVRPIRKAAAVFPRVETQPERKPKGEQTPKTKKVDTEMTAKVTDPISFHEFQKVDIRVGTVKKAEAIPGSKKLMEMKVDVGEERTLVAGLLGHYTAEELMGKQVVVLVNLEPAKLMGVESRGMILAVEDDAGVRLLVPDGKTVSGSRVK
jgi:methionyl-tRNA synthetase